MTFSPRLSDLVVDVGGDTLLRYGTLTRRLAPPTRGGEQLIETITRASPGGSITPQGTFLPVQAGAPKVTWIKDANGLYQPRLLLEAAATNKLTAPEDLSNAAWTKIGVTTPSINNPSPRNGDLTATFVREDTSTGAHAIQQGYTLGVATNPSGDSVWLKAAGRTKARFRAISGGSNEVSMTVDLTSGTVTASGVGGTAVMGFPVLTPAGNGWYVLQLYGTPNSGTGVTWTLLFQNGAGSESYTGDGVSGMYVWGCVATDNQIAGMYWGTGASRAADNFQLPYAYRIQPTAIFLDFIEQGSKYAGNGDRMIELKYGAGVWFSIYCSGSPNVGQPYGVTHSDLVVPTLAATPAFGDRVQLLALLRGDGSVELRQSLNLAAETTTGQSAAAPLETAGGTGLGLNQFTGGGALADKNVAVARALVIVNSLPSSIADVRSFLAGLPAA